MPTSSQRVLGCTTAAIVLPLALVALFIFLVFGYPYCALISAKMHYTGTMHRLNPVMDALERYHRDHGRYPPALCALTRDGYLPELPQLPPPFNGSYSGPKDQRGDGYAYDARGGSYQLYTFLSRPGDHTGWLWDWTESLTYYGPGYERGPNDSPVLGYVGRWAWFGFSD